MTKTTCDLCGKDFINYSIDRSVDCTTLKGKKRLLQVEVSFYFSGFYHTKKHIDICRSCKKEKLELFLQTWISKEEVE